MIKLQAVDLQSSTWNKLQEYYLERLNNLRAKNDNANLDPIDTAVLRGRIKEIKMMLSLGNANESQVSPLFDTTKAAD